MNEKEVVEIVPITPFGKTIEKILKGKGTINSEEFTKLSSQIAQIAKDETERLEGLNILIIHDQKHQK